MIEYHYEIEFELPNETYFTDWITRIIDVERASYAQIDFIFCSDEYLLDLNMRYLKHDTFTDIITFDYSDGKVISGDIFISVERLKENAENFRVELEQELLRVMCHGVLHLLGYNDKSEADVLIMREKESQMIKLFHVEQ
ncbi:MAG: rRNA maturation RNase YbeY [Bacteroidota bacterium]